MLLLRRRRSERAAGQDVLIPWPAPVRCKTLGPPCSRVSDCSKKGELSHLLVSCHPQFDRRYSGNERPAGLGIDWRSGMRGWPQI